MRNIEGSSVATLRRAVASRTAMLHPRMAGGLVRHVLHMDNPAFAMLRWQ